MFKRYDRYLAFRRLSVRAASLSSSNLARNLASMEVNGFALRMVDHRSHVAKFPCFAMTYVLPRLPS